MSLSPRTSYATVAFAVALVAVGIATCSSPSRVERAEAAAQRACEVFREPFDRTNPKMDALPAEERAVARKARLVATEGQAAKAARLDPRWSTLHDAWHDFVTDDRSVSATQVILAECRVALAG